ncbi:MAG: N-acetyl-gamma-glutamyl-phosphate reductase, partial [Bacteroidales bacterium]|nr:N-acetyl-gamma-glutamyl-phosphate reductase [Candidatus Cacconaster equifaecalis]
ATTHFSWRNNNLSTYKAFEHQHLKEINMNVLRMQPAFSGSIDFVPMRGDFARGIFASVQTRFDGSLQDAQEIYREFYKDAAFTFLYDGNLDLKQVVNTNKGLVTVEKHGSKLLVNSAIDNLLKGASGQAVQNMNLLLGLDEKAGLKLKASAF